MDNNNNRTIIPVVSYSNADKDKSLIFSENKGKSCIYRFINIVTGKSYIGSSMDFKRFNTYYSEDAMRKELSKGRSYIYSALLKDGIHNFSLDILEYCEIKVLIEREQYYFDLLKPEYNILKVAKSRLGCKHSEATKAKMSVSQRAWRNKKKIELSFKFII